MEVFSMNRNHSINELHAYIHMPCTKFEEALPAAAAFGPFEAAV
jgi:hypothetical protein